MPHQTTNHGAAAYIDIQTEISDRTGRLAKEAGISAAVTGYLNTTNRMTLSIKNPAERSISIPA